MSRLPAGSDAIVTAVFAADYSAASVKKHKS